MRIPLPRFVNSKISTEEDTKRFFQTKLINHQDSELEFVKKPSNLPNKHNIMV